MDADCACVCADSILLTFSFIGVLSSKNARLWGWVLGPGGGCSVDAGSWGASVTPNTPKRNTCHRGIVTPITPFVWLSPWGQFACAVKAWLWNAGTFFSTTTGNGWRIPKRWTISLIRSNSVSGMPFSIPIAMCSFPVSCARSKSMLVALTVRG